MKTTALFFNGSTTHVAIGNNGPHQIVGDQTIELWVRLGALAHRQNPIAKAYGGEGTITIETSGALSYYYGPVGADAEPYQGFYAGPAVAIGEWTHIAVVRDLGRGVLRWYRNGELIKEEAAAYPAAAVSGQQLLLGGGYAGAFHGHIAEVRLWSVARTAAQIQENMRRRLGAQPGLAGYWPLNDGEGAVAHDRSGNGLHGAVVNGQWDANGPLLRPSHESVTLPGNGWVDVGGVQVGGQFTQECWIRPALTDDAYHGFLGNQPTGVHDRSPSLWVFQRRMIHFAYGDGQSQQGGITGPVLSGEPGRWHHVAASYDGANYRIYVDGALVHTQATAAPSVNSPVRWIGRVDNVFAGDISEVRLWSIVRSEAQIRESMGQRLRGDEAGLVGYWPLDDGPAVRAADLGPNGAHGALNNAAWGQGDPGLRRATGLAVGGNGWIELGGGGVRLGQRYTQECWLRSTVTDNAYHGFMGNQPPGVGTRSPGLWVNDKRRIHFVYGDGVGQQGGLTEPVLSGDPTRWHHVAVTYEDNLFKIYVDGALVHTQATTLPSVDSPVLWIGRVDNVFVGELAEVRLWTRARTEAEIQADMHRRLTGTEADLVGYWPLDVASGDGLEDRARGLARGNVRGDARLVVTSHALQAAPPWSSALQLAAGEYVQLPTSDALKLGDHFTLEAWILPELTDDAYHGFLGHQPPGVGARSPSLWVYQRRRIHFVYGDGVGQQGGITEPVLSDTPGRWHHVAASYGDGVFKIYVDGVMVHTHQTSLPSINSPVGWIGRVDNFFSGAIADVRLWSRVRSDAEIYTDMRRRLWGQEPGLVAYWPLDDDSGQVARDRTEHGNHGTLTGPPRWRAAIALATTGVPSVEPPVIGALPSGQSSLGAPSGPSSEVQPIDLPSAVTNLGALEAEVFFVPFGLPIVFEGAVTVQPLEHAVSYAGKVTLTAPFQVTVDPLALALADGEDGPTWMVKFGMPQSRSISDVIQTDVLAQIPDVVRPAIEALVMPYLALYQHAIVILSNDDGEDEELGPYIAGVNLFATLPASTIPPLDLIHATFPQIGLDTRDVVLGVGASTAAQQNFFIGATLMLEVELGTPLVVLESLAFSLSRQVTDSTVGVLIAFRLNLAGELLKLRGGIELATGVGNSVSVWGALDADDGAWRDPFGVRGLTIVGLGVQVGATPTFPFVVIGVRGEVHIGDGLLGARVAIKVDASDWSKCILDLYSEEGIDLPALIGALTGGWLNVGSILAVRIKDLQLYIAPKGGTIAGVSYPPGLKIGGRLDLWGFQASVEGQLDFDQGGSLSGQIDPIVLAAGGVEFFRLSNVAGDGGASIDVVFTLSQVGGSVDGKLSLLGGVIASQVQATLTTSGFVATLSTGSWGIYQNASVALNAGRFRLSFGPSISVSVNIAGYNVGISVGTTITTEIDANSFSQAISFSFSAMGVSYSPGPFSISIPFQSVGQLADAFYQYARDLILGGLLGSIVQAAQIAFDWVKTNVTAAAQDVAKVFENVGASSVAIAQGLVTSFGIGAGEAVSYLSVGANEAAGILKDGFGWSVTQTGQWLKDVGGYTDTAVNSALNGAGYAANEVADFMGDVFGGSWIPHVDFPHWDHLDFNGY